MSLDREYSLEAYVVGLFSDCTSDIDASSLLQASVLLPWSTGGQIVNKSSVEEYELSSNSSLVIIADQGTNAAAQLSKIYSTFEI